MQDVVHDKGGDVGEADDLVVHAVDQSALDGLVGIELIDKRVWRADDVEVEVPDVHGVGFLRLLAVLVHIVAPERLGEAVGGTCLLFDIVDIGEAVAHGGTADEDVLAVDLLQIGEG